MRTQESGPIVVFSPNVFDPQKFDSWIGESGRSIRELRPKQTKNRATLIIYNGAFVLPEDEDWVPQPGDHITYCTLPKGGRTSEAILGVVLIIVGIFTLEFGGEYLIALGIGLLAMSLIPVPNVPNPMANQQQPSPTYQLQLSGNSARVGQAIPVLYGRHIIMPDFASQPYVEYNNSTNDQYYFAFFCLGQLDKFTLETIMIDDTDLTHFTDVETQLIGPQYPGVALTIVDPAVVNAPEVANNVLTYAQLVGPFAACGPGLQADYIGIDIFCPKGLFHGEDDGTLTSKSASWQVFARKIDDNGLLAGDWVELGDHTLTDATNTPLRRTYKYQVDPGRYEVYIARTDVESTDIKDANQLMWGGMRAYLTIDAPLEPTATFLAVKMRATSQLSGLTQRRFSVIIRRWLPTWNPNTGWSDPVETRSIAWAAADVLRNTAYGGKVPDWRIDLQTLYELDQIWTERGDTCNIVFDQRITVWQALSVVLRTGRARPIMRGSVFTAIRDQKQDLPVALFNMRNIKKGSFSLSYMMMSEDTVDGVEVQFFNEKTWATDYVRIPSPGVDESIDPAHVTLQGITDKNQVSREAAYMVADSFYRRTTLTFDTEMEGNLPAFGSLIGVSHDVASWGYGGDIEDWDGTTAIVSEDLTWTVGDHYAVLTDDQGDVYGPYKVTPGTADRSMQFVDAVPLDLVYTGTERERTRFAMGAASTYAKMCRVTGITPKDSETITITAIVEDDRVHDADIPYQGGGGGGGNDRVARYAPDGVPNYDAATAAQRLAYGFFADTDLKVGVHGDAPYVYDNS